MNLDRKVWFKRAKCTVLAMTVAIVLWMPGKITARTAVRGESERDAKAETQKTAVEVFKNIQVLKDIPASELIPSMRYIAASLGVGCDYCHQADHFDNDDKPTKQRARNMMKMMFAINQDNFNGKREVTCYTCHRGVAKAASIASLSAATNGGAESVVGSGSGGKAARATEPGEDGRGFERSSEGDAEHNGDTGEICRRDWRRPLRSRRIRRGWSKAALKARAVLARQLKPTGRRRIRRSRSCIGRMAT